MNARKTIGRVFRDLLLRIIRALDIKIFNEFLQFRVLRKNYRQLIESFSTDYLSISNLNLPENAMRFELLAHVIGTTPAEAFEIIVSLHKVRDIDGDVCEFGVAQGRTSAIIANELMSGDKNLYLFDTFEGLPPPSHEDELKDDIFNLGSIEAYTGQMACPETMVRKQLEKIEFPNHRIHIIKGRFDAEFAQSARMPLSVSFAYIDFDFYQPIRDALDFLHGSMPEGGIIIVDDYDFFSTGAKKAVDQFTREKGETAYSFRVAPESYGKYAVIQKIS